MSILKRKCEKEVFRPTKALLEAPHNDRADVDEISFEVRVCRLLGPDIQKLAKRVSKYGTIHLCTIDKNWHEDFMRGSTLNSLGQSHLTKVSIELLVPFLSAFIHP
jgi:hypothetical protein